MRHIHGPVVGQGAMTESIVTSTCQRQVAFARSVDEEIIAVHLGIDRYHPIGAAVVHIRISDLQFRLGGHIGKGAEGAEVIRIHRRALQPHHDAVDGIADAGVVDDIVAAAAQDGDAGPLSGYLFEEVLEPVCLEGHQAVEGTVDLQSAQHIETGAAVHIDPAAFVDGQGAEAVHQDAVVDNIGQVVIPDLIAHDDPVVEMGILTPGYQLHELLVVVGDHADGVFYHIRQLVFIGIDGHFHEDIQTVVRGDLQVGEFRAGKTIHIHAEIGRLASHQFDGRDTDILVVGIVDLEGAGGRADGGEYRVKFDRIAAESQFGAGIFYEGNAATGGGHTQHHPQQHQYPDRKTLHSGHETQSWGINWRDGGGYGVRN